MEALAARSSVLSPPGIAGDTSPSLSLPLRRASAAFPGPRRSPSSLAIATRWLRAPPRRGGGLLAGAGEDGSLDPADDTYGQLEGFLGYKDALMEVQTLRVNCSTEFKRREAFESHISDLKKDNERLRRLYTETLFKFTNQVKFHVEAQSLKEDLEKLNSRLLSMEEEHNRETEQLKHSSEMNINALENKLSHALVQQARDEAAMKQLKSELSAHKAHVDMLSSRLEQVTADVHSQYKNEIEDLRDVISVEQEEKKDMHRKLQNAENELRITRMKQSEQQRDSVSVQHVETLKQKVMKLRKENESLKRRLASSKA